eukprot:5684994-Pyramimonas_sp.AAC.1
MGGGRMLAIAGMSRGSPAKGTAPCTLSGRPVDPCFPCMLRSREWRTLRPPQAGAAPSRRSANANRHKRLSQRALAVVWSARLTSNLVDY